MDLKNEDYVNNTATNQPNIADFTESTRYSECYIN